ncbi:MAG: ceramidase domain-containing protein [Opitutaceae bacterium]|nr:ceramidase domain-containing protein [Opitutaceae bacterium]
MSHLIREPQNTWSNLAYLVGGALLLGSAASSRSARSLGLALIGVGIGSFLYHASASRTLRHLDVGAMYWVFLSAILFSLGSVVPRLRIWIEKHGMALGFVTLALGGAGAAYRNVTIAGVKPLALNVTIVVATTVLIVALVLTAVRRRTRSAVNGSVTALVAFGAAVVFQIGDRPGGFLCDPAAPIQAHALWHCLSALAFVVAVKTIDRPVNPEHPHTLPTQPGQ